MKIAIIGGIIMAIVLLILSNLTGDLRNSNGPPPGVNEPQSSQEGSTPTPSRQAPNKSDDAFGNLKIN